MVNILADLYMSESGDLRVAPGGDLGVTETTWREDAQNAYIRIMTSPGDFLLYPTIGADLTQLYGKPQSENTANLGVRIITDALEREGAFIGKAIDVVGVPTGPQTIRFDVKVKSGSRTDLLLSIEKDLGIEY